MMTEIIDLIRPGDRVLCAVSGGMDSVYLLDQMRRLLPSWGAVPLAAHFNHRLRGEESDRDEAFVRELCAEWGIPLVVGYAAGLGDSEAEAREARYAFLEKTADAEDCAWIVTAHTADDQLETMLLNLARGAGLRGLAGIPFRRGRILRPLLNLPRSLIARPFEEHRLSCVEDSTNASYDFARNRVRHEAVPALCSVNPQAVRHAAMAAEYLREDEEYLVSLAEEALSLQTGDGMALRDLRSLPRPVRARVFRALFGHGLSAWHIERLHEFCMEDTPAFFDLPGCRAVRERERLFPAPEKCPPIPELELSPGLDLALPAHGLRVRVSEKEPAVEIYDSLIVYRFKSAEIRGKLMLTPRKPGDAVRLAGRGCTKRLSDLFAERGISPSLRDSVPVIRDGAGVAAVVGFGAAERLVPQPGDAVLTVLIEKLEKEKMEREL